MNIELVWLIVPLCGLLSQLGGTFNKLYRRIGIPALVTWSAWYWLGWSWWYLPMFISMFGAFCLPFTLKGDSLHDWWFNWVWIWILGYLFGLPSVFLSSQGFLFGLVPAVVCGICGTLSNVKTTAKYFQWKFCEFIIWAMAIYPYALFISLRS